MKTKDPREGWAPLSIGCHWTRGPYTVSTIRQGTRSGYVLVRDHRVIAEFIPWSEVERLVSANA